MDKIIKILTVALFFCVTVIPSTSKTADTTVRIKPKVKVTTKQPSRKKVSYTVEATAYDVSIESCGKTDGITASGFDLTGHTWQTARCVAADWSVFPKGSKLYIEFEGAPKYNGIYYVRDKGGAIKGRRIDLFIETRQGCINFGRRKARVTVLQ